LATVVAAAAWWFPRSPDSPPAPAASAVGAGTSASPVLTPPSPSPSPPAPSNGPLSVTVVQRGSSRDCTDTRFYLPRSIDQIKSAVPLPPADFHSSDAVYNGYVQTLGAWATSVGGFLETDSIRFSVEGNSTRATILTGIRINLVSRASLTSKTALWLGECGGVAPPRPFSVDFATTPPRVKPVPGESVDPSGNVVPTKPVSFPFTVSETDPEIFDLSVEPGPVCDCLWTASLSYTQAGRAYTTIIDDGGRPFHAVPTDQVPQYTLINGFLERVQR
jgi:hypothetical protein